MSERGEVKLEKSIGLWSGVGIITGIIVGSGIFVSPKGVLVEGGSVGMALVFWVLCGLICLNGAHCFAELGTMIPDSGGIYAYIDKSFGEFTAFLYLWVALIILFPAANAAIALTFAHYVLQPIFPDCELPSIPIRLLAACAIALLTFVNCASVRLATQICNVLTIIKVTALGIIIITGIYVLAQGHVENFDNSFENSKTDMKSIALALYSGLFSFSGWYTLNFLSMEIEKPHKNLPRAIWISLPLITVIYLLTNIAYFAVLPAAEILNSDAVAVTFSRQMFGIVAIFMPIIVACSTFGSLNGCIMSVSRLFYDGAQKGHLPKVLALIHVEYLTPFPALLLEGVISILMLLSDDVFFLINCVTFVESLAFLVCAFSFFYFRWKWPDAVRPIKISLIWPSIFLLVSLFLVIVPIITAPYETLWALVILATGIPVYFVFVAWKSKPEKFLKNVESLTKLSQKLTYSTVKDD